MARVTVADLRVDLARIEGKVDTFVRQMEVQDNRTTEIATAVAENAKTSDARFSKVENRQHFYAGGSGAAGVLLGYLVEFFSGRGHA